MCLKYYQNKMGLKFILYIALYTYCFNFLYVLCEDSCEKGFEIKNKRYLLFNVNPGEGFNLRRDVYLRIANLVHKLNEIESWTLVLPPWGNLYHWQNTPRHIFHPWKDFFDIKSLNRWIPVMEFHDFLKSETEHLDSAFILQNYENMWETEWEEKYEVANCLNQHNFRKNGDGGWSSLLWNVRLWFDHFSCLSFQGLASSIIPFLTKDQKEAKSVYLDHAEVLLHDHFGSSTHWSARRSMRFASPLAKEAEVFRQKFLDSDNERDGTQMPEDWRDFKPKRKIGIGGPYISTHMRRRDFIYARKDEVPSIKEAARQLRDLLQKMNLNKLFVATDAPNQEIEELRSYLKDFKVFTFEPSSTVMGESGDGGTAIVDQIICSHARYFIGTSESTFSFRIQEEREILGFPSETTFNRLCGENSACEPATKWKIVYK